MARFTNRIFLGLNRLYTYISSDQPAPTELNTEGQVQLVHDLSRMAELAAIETDRKCSGFFQVGQDNVHAGGDTVEATINPYDAATLVETWGREGERWIWLYRFAASANSTAIMGASSSARLALCVGALGGALARRDFLLATWGASSATTITTDLSATFPAALTALNATTAESRQLGIDLPMPIFPNSVLTWRTAATAAQAGTIRISTICWIGPIGVFPPGLR